eukprot:TRINITY_DN1851_c0_g1_i3.p1 TRINITY_DN1851_c0_g1~~TRINITY_DN1851_c0_g1_i3.p1  ORF type:complete len:165 (+),score=8.01 TRINITY_DN1851_c0_g1_i3:57-497(+)
MTDNRSNNSWAGPDESGHSFDNSVTLESLRNALKSFARERDWEQYHTPRNLALALVGEVGELCEIFQWRADAELSPGLPGWSPADKEHLGEELSDVLLYLIRLADRCQIGPLTRLTYFQKCSPPVSRFGESSNVQDPKKRFEISLT